MTIKAKLNYLRISPRKVRIVAREIKGMDVEAAEAYLKGVRKRAARPLLKLLKSAVANAKHNFNLEKDGLFIATIQVNQGPSLKRWRPAAFGRAHPLKKRSSHVLLEIKPKEGSKPTKTGQKITKKTKAKAEKERTRQKKKIVSPKKHPPLEKKETLRKISGLEKVRKKFFRRKAF